MAGPIEVEGLAELSKSLKQISRELPKQLNKELRVAAQPVARTAERMAFNNISGMKRYRRRNWSKMRVGANGGLVYVVPKQRGQKQGRAKRPNLVNLMRRRAMEPAARKQEPVVRAAIERAISDSIRRAGY